MFDTILRLHPGKHWKKFLRISVTQFVIPGKESWPQSTIKKIIVGKPLFLIEYGVKFNQGQSNTIHELSEKGETGIGIREFFGAVLPESKAQKIRELQKQGYKIAIVGDGCNGRVCE